MASEEKAIAYPRWLIPTCCGETARPIGYMTKGEHPQHKSIRYVWFCPLCEDIIDLRKWRGPEIAFKALIAGMDLNKLPNDLDLGIFEEMTIKVIDKNKHIRLVI